MMWFHLDAPSSQAGARKPLGLDIRIGSRSKSQAKFQTAARRESSEDSMKRVFLLIVVPALLVALAFAQTPAASINTDQAIKGCLGGSEGNYTVVEDGTGHIFKITTNSVDLKQHLGHDVTLIGHRASGESSGAADNSFAVTELNMISEHCAAAAAAPTATVSTPSETTVTPDAAATAPAATISTVPETAVTPAAVAAPPAETAVTPPADTAAPVATVSTPSETVSTPAARPQRLSKTPAVDATTTPAPASPPSETARTPPPAPPTPGGPRQHAPGDCQPPCCSRHYTRCARQARGLMALDCAWRAGNRYWHAGPSPQQMEKTEIFGADGRPKSF